MAGLLVTAEPATAIPKLAVADSRSYLEESVTVIATDAVPTELCAGVPEIAPVELLIDKPLGKPLAP
jgi:hypothetical protein